MKVISAHHTWLGRSITRFAALKTFESFRHNLAQA
jgi:hypothetical protein